LPALQIGHFVFTARSDMVRRFWTQKQDFGPPAADAVAYDNIRQRTMLLVNGNTWEWDGTGWAQLDDMGPTGEQQILAYSSTRQRLVAFGTADQLVSQTWEWDGASWTQLADTGPTARLNSAMTCDNDRDRVVLFGGQLIGNLDSSGAGNLSDTWEWDGTEWTQQDDDGPERRRGHAMAYDAARKQSVLFGGQFVQPAIGFSGVLQFDDTWVWNGDGWKQAAGFGPSKRSIHCMVFDDTIGQTVLFGGVQVPGIHFLGDTWQWDGTRWAQCQDIGPSGRYAARLAYDSIRKCTVLFGGGGNSIASVFDGVFEFPVAAGPQLIDTWELSEKPPS
jgi:hypothetical protein